MKMAKASQADLDMALDLIGVLDDIERGHFPFRFSDPDNEATEWLDPDDAPQMANLLYQLKRLLNRGSIGRVIDYCLNDVRCTLHLHRYITRAGGLIDPRDGTSWLNVRVGS